MADDPVAIGNVNFDNWKETQKLEIERAKAAADIMVKLAEADLKRAEAAKEWIKVAMMREVQQQLHAAYFQLNHAVDQLKQRIKVIETQHEHLRSIRNGQSAGAVSVNNMWASYRVMERYLPFESLSAIVAKPLESSWRAGTNYFDVGHPNKTCDAVDKTFTTLHALIVWLEQHKTYLPRKEAEPYLPVCWAFNLIADTAIPERKSLDEQIQQATDAVYKVWEPGRFAGLPEDPRKKPPDPSH